MAAIFRFTLKKKKHRFFVVVVWLYCLLSWLGFLANTIILGSYSMGDYATVDWQFWRSLTPYAHIVPIALLATAFLPGRKFKYVYVLVPVALVWLFMPILPWMALPGIILSILDYRTRLPELVVVADDNVRLTGVINRQISWDELQHVILKDGLLTLDKKDNRIIQREVLDSTIDEMEFNQFCQSKLLGSSHSLP